MSLFTRAQGNASKMYSMNELFGADSSFGFGVIGAKLDNKAKKLSMSLEFNGLQSDDQKLTLTGKISF